MDTTLMQVRSGKFCAINVEEGDEVSTLRIYGDPLFTPAILGALAHGVIPASLSLRELSEALSEIRNFTGGLMARKKKSTREETESPKELSLAGFASLFGDTINYFLRLLEKGEPPDDFDELLLAYLSESLRTSAFLIRHLKATGEQGKIDVKLQLSQLPKMRYMIELLDYIAEGDKPGLLAQVDDYEKALKEASRVN
jgi:hypothetical protein